MSTWMALGIGLLIGAAVGVNIAVIAVVRVKRTADARLDSVRGLVRCLQNCK